MELSFVMKVVERVRSESGDATNMKWFLFLKNW